MADNAPNKVSAFGTRRFAQEFVRVANDAIAAYKNELPEQQRHATSRIFAHHYLYLHGIELCLKSYMIHTGSDLRKLLDVGHDLEEALDICLVREIREQCPKLSDTHIEIIKASSPMYMDKEFEYLTANVVRNLHHTDQLAEVAGALLDGLNKIEMEAETTTRWGSR